MSLTLKLRKTTSEANRVTKSFIVADDITLTGTFKEEQDILHPVIEVESSTNLSGYNYCEIEVFNRKYFMQTSVVRNNLWRLTLNVDVLSTYDSGIRGSLAIVKRSEDVINYYINDGVFYTEQRKVVTHQTFKKNDVDAVLGATDEYYLLVAGG